MKRGRPRKFDRPSRLITMTLPEDVIAVLRARDSDLAQAIVGLVGRDGRKSSKRIDRAPEVVNLVQIARGRFLITIDSRVVGRLPQCELVPFGRGTSFFALEPRRGLADLALAVVDRLDEPNVGANERAALIRVRRAIRTWMRDKSFSYETRAIVVIKRGSSVPRRR
jgi:hypothetical protein